MILAFDTYYFDDKARTVCIAFDSWASESVSNTYTEILGNIEPYTPGEFYKRELPCVISLLKTISLEDVEAIVVDGFVYLDDQNQLGLGGHLYHQLQGVVPVIGVAKTNFATLTINKGLVYRGESERPLYVTAIGTDLEAATQNIREMQGPHRIPILLKYLDRLSRESGT